ncbi:MAG: hypothetical protein CSB16_00455 [Clostridiales bacterium]|nr:MAG: hypothetical protein CSB16_00455 [Clostridiales bacterium]
MNNEGKIKQLLKDTSILMVSNFLLKGITFFLLPLYTKYLSTSQLGISDTITTTVSFLFPLLVMALDGALGAFYFDEENEDYQNRVFNTVRILLVISSLVPIILAFFAAPISSLLFGSNKYYLLIIISLASVSFNLWHLPFSILARLKNKMLLFSIVNVVSSAFMIALNIVFLVVFNLGEMSLILSTFIINLLKLLIYFYFFNRSVATRFFDKNLSKKIFKFSIPLMPSTIAGWILNLSDRYFLIAFIGTSSVGLYGIANRFASILTIVTSAIFTAYTPFAFRYKNEEDSKKIFGDILNFLSLVLLSMSIFAVIFRHDIFRIMIDPSYNGAKPIMGLILFSQFIYGLNVIVGYGISFMKKSIYHTISVWVGAIVNIVLNYIFIPKYGIVAAAATTLVGYTVMFIITYRFAQKLYRCDYEIYKISLLAIISFVSSHFIGELSLLYKILAFIVIVLLSIIIFKKSMIKLFLLLKTKRKEVH